ncbi:hypothetical protein ABIE44_002818 [Marmoricola sp. OAE513]|uniref:hypothetical protein n=1 Tax=Marmoricola sp. OAE513 TaxID=2817894 RepID=UPI001AE73A5B
MTAIVVLAGLAVIALLVWAFLYDRQHGRKRIVGSHTDAAAGEARSQAAIRNIHGLGAGSGP